MELGQIMQAVTELTADYREYKSKSEDFDIKM